MVETIETGTVDKSHTSLAPYGIKNFMETIFFMIFDFIVSVSYITDLEEALNFFIALGFEGWDVFV